jgi:hypothetical protein
MAKENGQTTDGNTGTSPISQTCDVPGQVFDTFIKALVDANVPSEITDRLRQTLLVDKKFNERALRDAVLGEGASQ